jgi:aryl-alcohol dehydrogenase-like predicted oxidoreductase
MKLALGTAQFGMNYGIGNSEGQVSFATAKTMLELAKASGIKTLDTAVAYGDSETRLGELGVGDFNLVTKLPATPLDCLDLDGWVIGQISMILTRLRLGCIHGLLLHRPDQLLQERGFELYDALQQAKSLGLVQKIGVSIYSPEELNLLTPKYHFDIVQAPLNLIDRRLQKSGWLSRLKDKGIEIHTRSAFLQGLLLLSREGIPAQFEQWNCLWDEWNKWLKTHDEKAVQACLAYPLLLSEIDFVVVGADSVAQLSQILIAAHGEKNPNFPDLQCDDEKLINPSRWCLP